MQSFPVREKQKYIALPKSRLYCKVYENLAFVLVHLPTERTKINSFALRIFLLTLRNTPFRKMALQKTTLTFLRTLRSNNNREWFNANKDLYLAAKADAEQLAMELVAGIGEFDSSIGLLEPKDCMFRIYRDARFSHDKSPYKTNLGVVVQRGGKKTPYGCYYVHVEPGTCFLSGGIYMPIPETLKAIRQSIDASWEEFEAIVKEKNFKKYFGGIVDENRLVKVPQGFDKTSPAAEFLKQKDFYVTRAVADEELYSPTFLKQTIQAFKSLKPLNDFFNAAIDDME